MATNAELAKQITLLVDKIQRQHKELRVHTSVSIYRGKEEPTFLLTADGTLVYARSGRPIDCNKLNHADLSAIRHQLSARLNHISQ